MITRITIIKKFNKNIMIGSILKSLIMYNNRRAKY